MTDNSDSMHKLALQLSQVAQQYEKYVTDIETLAKKYEGLPTQVTAILGQPISDQMIEMLHNVTLAKEVYVGTARRCRSVLLDVSQKLLKADG